jgi:hypothetical protein
LIFGAVFARLASKFEKSTNMAKKIFLKNQKSINNAEFYLDFKFVEKASKKCTKKVLSKTSVPNISKSGKSAYFRHFFADKFFWVHLLKLFQHI